MDNVIQNENPIVNALEQHFDIPSGGRESLK
jgi:hypothetical protein